MAEQVFKIERIYVKNSSFEFVDAPQIFVGEWKPEMNFEIQTKSSKLPADNRYEVSIVVQLKIKIKEQEAVVIKVEQSGVFHVEGFDVEQQKQLLAAYCPNILYPYARQVVSELMVQGSLPPTLLNPIDFNGLYQQQKETEKAKAENEPVN